MKENIFSLGKIFCLSSGDIKIFLNYKNQIIKYSDDIREKYY